MRRFPTPFFALVLCLAGSAPAADDEQSKPRFVHFKVDLRDSQKSQGAGPFTDGPHVASVPSPAEVEAGQRAVLQFLETRGRGPLSIADTLQLYAAAGKGGFHSVHGLLGKARGQGIDDELSRQLGAARSQFQTEVLEALVRAIKAKTPQLGVGVNDFGATSDPARVNAKTDIDFTLYPHSEQLGADWLVAEYERLFREISRTKYGVELTPHQLDIVAHRYDATIPDWRQQHGVADFVVRLRTGRSLLKANSEAYFLEGAFVQQVMRRSVTAQKPTFTWMQVADDGTVAKQPTPAADVPLYFYRPEIKQRHAFGGAVGNLHAWRAHQGDLELEAKYLLRSLDNGAGLMAKNKQADFVSMDPEQRGYLLGGLYSSPSLGLSEKTREKLLATYEVARNVQRAHSKNETLPPQQAFAPLVDYLRRTAGPDVKLDDAWALAEARRVFKRMNELALLSNVLLSAEPRFKDWYAPDRTQKIAFVGEDGVERTVEPTPENLTKLQFAAFFEVHDSLEVLDPKARAALKQKLVETNPRLRHDVEIVERLIAKERELMLPNDADPTTALEHREQAAHEVLTAWDAMGKTPPSVGWRRVLDRAGSSLATGAALENYTQSRMVDALSAASGERAGLQLEAFRQATSITNERFLGPVWMSRIAKANSVTTVLTVWVKHGRIDEEVVKTAVTEGLTHLPLVGMALSVQQGGGGAVAQIVLTQTIPGFGQVVLLVTSARGVVELGGALIFEPLKRDKVLLAYQGSLKAGTVTAQRTLSARPSLLQPIDPTGSMTIGQRREAVYGYFRPRIVEGFKRRYGGAADPGVMIGTFAEYEGELLPVVMGRHVADWWNATGPFAGDDANTVKRMMDEAYGDELRGELIKQLIADYTDTKKKLLQAAQAQHEKNLGLIAQIARRTEVAEGEYAQAGPDIRRAHEVVGEATFGQLQQEAPFIEPRLELVASPHYRTARDEQGRSQVIVEDLNVRAKVMASGTAAHPEPFSVRWRMRSGSEDRQFTEGMGFKSEGDPDRLPAAVTLVAEVLDANGRSFLTSSLELPLSAGPSLVGQDVCDEPATVADAAHCLEQAALEAERLAAESSKACAEAATHVRDATQARAGAENGLQAYRARVEAAERRLPLLTGLGQELTAAHEQNDRAAANLDRASFEADKLVKTLCAPAPLAQVPELRRQVQSLAERGQREKQTVDAALLDTEGASRELEGVVRELRALEQVPAVNVDHRALVDRLADANADVKKTRDAQASLQALLTRVRRNFEAAGQMQRGAGDARLAAWKERVEAAARKDPQCADRVADTVTRLEREADQLSTQLAALEARRKVALAALDEVPKLRSQADETVRVASAAEAAVGRLRSLLADASTCASQVENAPPSEAQLVDLLQHADCSRLPGSVAGFDLGTKKVVCVCPPGAAMHANGRQCVWCATADQLCQAALARGDFQAALRVAQDAAGCDFAPFARQAIERSMQQQRELACLRSENAVYEDLNGGRLEAAVQRLQALQGSGCRLTPQTVQDVRNAVELRRKQDELRRRDERAQRELAMWNQLINNMNQVVRQMNQPPPAPVPSRTTPPVQPWTPPPPVQPTTPTTPTTPVRPARPSVDCEKKFCPVCGNDDIQLMGQSTDAQCMDCKKKYATQIADCSAGGRAIDDPGRSLSQFRDHYVMRCVKGTQRPIFRVKGPSAKPLPTDEVCTVAGDACTLVECGFQADRWNAQR